MIYKKYQQRHQIAHCAQIGKLYKWVQCSVVGEAIVSNDSYKYIGLML